MNYFPLIYGLRDHERYVYHYTKLATARDYILRDNTLRLGPFERTNDPREARQWQFNVGSTRASKDLEPYDLQDISKWMSNSIQRQTRVACFCIDLGPLSGDHLSDIYKRGFSRARMWSQYAENHQGVCLVFDMKKLMEAMRRKAEEIARTTQIFLEFSPVNYANQPLAGSMKEDAFTVVVEAIEQIGRDNYPLHHAMRWWRNLFFQKVEDWSHEAEWRSVVLVASPDPIDIDIRESLVGVIHGDRMTRRDSEALFALTDRPEVEHMGLSWKNGCPWYDLAGGPWSYSDRHLPGFDRRWLSTEHRWPLKQGRRVAEALRRRTLDGVSKAYARFTRGLPRR